MNISFEKIDKLIETIGYAKSVLENEKLEILSFQLLGETSKQVKRNATKNFIKSTLIQSQIPYFHLATREPAANIELDYCINMFIEQAELIIGKRMETEEAIGVIKAFSIPNVADIEKELFSNCDSMHDIEAACNIYKKRLSGKIDSDTIMSFRTRAKSGFPGFNILHERDLIEENELSNIRHCFYYIAINAADLCENVVNLLNLYSPTQDQQTEQPQAAAEERTRKVTTDAIIELLKLIGTTSASNDKAKIAKLIAYITGYSVNTIRQRLTNTEELTSKHKDEVDRINELFKELNISISIPFNKNR